MTGEPVRRKGEWGSSRRPRDSTSSLQPRGRVARPGPDGRPPKEYDMQKLYAAMFSLVAVAQHRIREEKGATAVEYGLLVGLIAVAIIATVSLLGSKLDGLFSTIKDALPGKAAAAG